MRLKTYSLGSTADVKRSLFRTLARSNEAKEIIAPISKPILLQEIENIRASALLTSNSDYDVFCSTSAAMPNIMLEIARLREITYRQVGEGTNRSYDMDEYDLFYDQLFVWDRAQQEIIGAYRLGKGKEIIEQYGVKGLYISSLFKVDTGAVAYLEKAIEMGRSFVVAGYQAKPLSLFLLWRGILLYLLKNPEYRYLIGPVSISNQFSDFSKELIVEFIRSNFFAKEVAQFFEPRKMYKLKLNNKELDKKLVLNLAKQDINRFDKFIQDIEPNYRMPVLLKKYLQQNARFVAFNVDPKFNFCLDGLMIQDLSDLPFSLLEFSLKDWDKKVLYERFKEWPDLKVS
ncbi:MAG: GNAT family N-acetyltransferase [Bacteroidales bacterium]|nr:GNAT family N-acetyltransferase [Bacteroidales bacterium]